MKHKYGEFSDEQFAAAMEKLRKQIFFLLLLVDPETNNEYVDINVESTFRNILFYIDGMNSLLGNPVEFVRIESFLERALLEYQSDVFDFAVYRKLVLDAGNEVLKIGG